MRNIIIKLMISLIIINLSLVISYGQTWKELMDSSKVYQEKQEFDTALKWVLLSLPQAEKEFGKNDTNYTSTLSSISEIFYYQGDLDSAIFYGNMHLSICRTILETDHPELATSINNIAYFYDCRGNYMESEPLYKESLEMHRRIYKSDHPGLANSINNIAMFYNDRGNYTEAEPLLKEALEMRRRLFKGDHPELATSINNIAAFYNNRGNYTEAEPLYKEAHEMRRRLFKGDHLPLAISINCMAVFYNGRGNYTEAEPLFKEALEMSRRLFKGDHPNLAQSINNMACFYDERGNYTEAEPLYKEALEMSRRLFKGDHPNLAQSINNMAVFFNDRGNYTEAELLYKEALEIRRRIFKGDHPDLSISINNMALFYAGIGDYKSAEPLLKEALEMYRRIFKGDHPDLAQIINNMASFYNDRGNNTEAEPLYKEALAMAERLFKDEHPLLANCLIGSADLLNNLGRQDEAKALLDRAYAMTLKRVQEYFPYLDEKQKVDFWANTMENRINHYYKFGNEYYKHKPEIAEKMLDITLATKGIVLNSTQKSLSKVRYSKRLFEDWQNTRQFWLRLVQNPQMAKKMGINVDSVGQAASELEKEISGQSLDFKKAFDTSFVRWKDVQKILTPDEVSIEIVRVRGNKDTISYTALITKKDSRFPELVSLNNGQELEENYIKRYANLIEKQRNGRKLSKEDLQELGTLYNQFWKPIQEKIYGIKTVYLSLDGVYNEFNLNTLLNPETGKYILDELDLRILTSTRDLVRMGNLPGSLSGNTPLNPLSIGDNKVKLFGDPQFELKKEVSLPPQDTTGLSAATRNYYLGGILDYIAQRGISPLPGTKIEINKISNDFASKDWKVEDFTGDAALEENVKLARNPRILHIATHGVFLKDVEYVSQEQEFENKKYVENPLLRSMLLFAGAQNTIKGETSGNLDRDDGILTAYEAMNLDLDNTELVVLSACETGLGEVRNGEGVYGLQRAFQVAGAKSLIMSLWTVSDQATQELMTGFYDKWLSGKSKRSAFRESQMELKKKYPGFYYWGAFVMVGE